jgi:hypothetical protein
VDIGEAEAFELLRAASRSLDVEFARIAETVAERRADIRPRPVARSRAG